MRKNLLTMDAILAKEIIYMLENESYQPGDKFPSERFLCEKFHVQRATIRNALAILVKEKYIACEERRGYFVLPRRTMISTHQFQKNVIHMSAFDSELLRFERILTDKRLSGKMLLPEETEVFKITRLYYDQGAPISYECSYTPCEIFPSLTEELGRSKPALALLLDYLQTDVEKSNQKVTLIYANEMEAELFRVEHSTPMLKYKGLVYDKKGRLIHYFENIMKKDKFAFIHEAEKR